MVDVLIKGGADMNIEDDEWCTPFEMAVINGKIYIYFNFVAYLIEDFVLWSFPLIGNSKIVEIMLRNGANVNGRSLLSAAADLGKKKSMKNWFTISTKSIKLKKNDL